VCREGQGNHGDRVDSKGRADAPAGIDIDKRSCPKAHRDGEEQKHRLGASSDTDRDLEDGCHYLSALNESTILRASVRLSVRRPESMRSFSKGLSDFTVRSDTSATECNVMGPRVWGMPL